MKIVVTFLSGGRAGQSLSLTAVEKIRIGRRKENEIALDADRDLAVSGFHAELRRAKEGYELVDLDSRNGVFVAGRRVRALELEGEVEIQLGADGPRLRLQMQDDRCILASPIAAAKTVLQDAPAQGPVPIQQSVPQLPKALPATRRRRRRLVSSLAIASAILVAGAGAVALWIEMGSPEAALDPAQCGRIVRDFGPGQALSLGVGVARLDVPREALPSKGRIRAELLEDRSLDIALEPVQELALPATVTLPLAPGADLAEPFGPHGPVALLESPGRLPMLLRPERFGPDGMSVRLPHFSKVRSSLYDDACEWMKKQGRTMDVLVSKSSPALLNITAIRRSKSFSTSGDLTALEISVQAATADGAAPTKSTRPFFAGLEVRASAPNDVELAKAPLDADGKGALNVTPGQPGPGKPPVLVVVLTLLAASGNPIAYTTITLPAGKLWESTDCIDAEVLGKPKRFTIYYLRPEALTDDPDTGYAGKTAAAGGVPSRAIDACTALLHAHRAYREVEFNDPKNVPGETDVWLQPWEESSSGNLRDYIMPRTTVPDTFDVFKVTAAHELAHRFQHQYSWALFSSGAWFHEASAEFLANKVFGYGRAVDRLTLAAEPRWLRKGLMSGADTVNYGYASFLAYLFDRYGVAIGGLWPASSNLSSWAAVLDAQLAARGSSLSGAFEAFARVWLIDHDWGTGWGEAGVKGELVEILGGNTFNFSASNLRVKGGDADGVANLSAGGMAISWRAGAANEGAAIFGGITVPAGKGWIGLVPGEEIDGRAGTALKVSNGGHVAAGTERIAFALGSSKGALDRTGARITYWYSDWSAIGGSAGGLSWDLWAIPQPVGLSLVEDASKQKTLRWSASPLERHKDLFAGYRIELRNAAGQVIHGDDKRATELALPAEVIGRAQDACVQVRDAEGNLGPEACLSLGIGELQGRWRWISNLGEINGKQVAMQYWFDFGPPLPDGTIRVCSTLIGKVGESRDEDATDPPRCVEQLWRQGGRGLVLFSQKGKWKADCEIRRRDRLRLDCLVEEPFFGGGISHLTANAEKQ